MNNPDARHRPNGQGMSALGENVAPVAALTVERREAPHPYVTGVQRAFARRAADRVHSASRRA